MIGNATDDGADSILDLGNGDTMTLIGVVAPDLHQDDFLFG